MAKNKYLVLARSAPKQEGQGGEGPSPEEMQKMFAAYKAWMEKFKDSIEDVGDKLVGEARVLRSSGVEDGPFVETKEVVGGYMILTTETIDEAVEVMKAGPMSSGGASFEIRQLSGAKM